MKLAKRSSLKSIRVRSLRAVGLIWRSHTDDADCMPPQIGGRLAGPPEVSAEQGKQVEFGLTDQVLEQARTVTGSADKLLDGELR